MIRYVEATPHDKAHDKKWEAAARTATKRANAAKAFVGDGSLWKRVKPVFMRLQYYKCIYCERPLGCEEYGSIEHDVEHFRPKSAVSDWPTHADATTTYGRPLGGPNKRGYYWLAYDPDNYATSCKTCNSILKNCAFPIFGRRGRAGSAIQHLNNTEKPALLYPLGNQDEDPEALIKFDGVTAIPCQYGDLRDVRARIIIDFFKLNLRPELRDGRLTSIYLIYSSFVALQGNPSRDRKVILQRILNETTSDQAPHAACSRAFYRLINSDLGTAEQYVIGSAAPQL
jgi:hypothetical protein